MVSRSWDNRVGCYVALETARRVAEAGGAPGEVIAVAAIGEEVGDFAGARTTAYAVEPDFAVAIDVTHAKDVPEAEVAESGDIRVGGGPVISRGAPLAQRVSDLLVETAEQEQIAHGVEVVRGLDPHRRRRLSPEPRGNPDRPRLGRHALHPHADGARLARRRREHRAAARRLRAARRRSRRRLAFPAPKGAAGRMYAWT